MPTPNQPAILTELPWLDAEYAFQDDSPAGLFPDNQNSNFGLVFRRIFAEKIQELVGQQDRIFREKFVSTSSEFLDEHEYMYGVPTGTTKTAVQRRAAIQARMRKGWFTRSLRQQVVEDYISATFGASTQLTGAGVPIDVNGITLYSGATSLAGIYEIVENITNFSYDVRIVNTVGVDQGGLARELARVTPAHISFTITITGGVTTGVPYGSGIYGAGVYGG